MFLEVPETKFPRAVHEHTCERCPINTILSDPEAEDYIRLCKSGQMEPSEAIYACAWRPEKICKGIADRVGYFYIGVDNG